MAGVATKGCLYAEANWCSGGIERRILFASALPQSGRKGQFAQTTEVPERLRARSICSRPIFEVSPQIISLVDVRTKNIFMWTPFPVEWLPRRTRVCDSGSGGSECIAEANKEH